MTKTHEEHEKAIICATRGPLGSYIDAVIAAVADGYDKLPAFDMAWAQRILDLKRAGEIDSKLELRLVVGPKPWMGAGGDSIRIEDQYGRRLTRLREIRWISPWPAREPNGRDVPVLQIELLMPAVSINHSGMHAIGELMQPLPGRCQHVDAELGPCTVEPGGEETMCIDHRSIRLSET